MTYMWQYTCEHCEVRQHLKYNEIHNKTRLLGRSQPQMYPPIALNQYTLGNRTHKHFIYMLQGPTNILK